MNTRLLKFSAVLGIALFSIQIIAIYTDLYWNLWWLDIFMHFLGGLFLAFLGVWLYFHSGYIRMASVPSKAGAFFFILLSVIVLGVAWELYEFMADAMFAREGYWRDTLSDLGCDIAGGLLGYVYYARKYLGRND